MSLATASTEGRDEIEAVRRTLTQGLFVFGGKGPPILRSSYYQAKIEGGDERSQAERTP